MPRERVLIVDDNPANVKLVAFVLAEAGYEILSAADAEQALVRIEQERPAMILMDLQLPRMSGLELTRRLKAQSGTRDIVIVAFTASAMKGDQERAIAAGCDGYIAKPVDVDALPGFVARHLPR